jgi:hypothetical protein
MRKLYIGIDNGVTGTIGVIDDEGKAFQIRTPVKKELSYTKEKQIISRIDITVLRDFLLDLLAGEARPVCGVERPMINSSRFKPTVSAARSLEATLIVLEDLKIPYVYIDSRKWQRKLLPGNLKGPKELKLASRSIAKRLYPQALIDGDDADGLLIAEYLRKYGG